MEVGLIPFVPIGVQRNDSVHCSQRFPDLFERVAHSGDLPAQTPSFRRSKPPAVSLTEDDHNSSRKEKTSRRSSALKRKRASFPCVPQEFLNLPWMPPKIKFSLAHLLGLIFMFLWLIDLRGKHNQVMEFVANDNGRLQVLLCVCVFCLSVLCVMHDVGGVLLFV